MLIFPFQLMLLLINFIYFYNIVNLKYDFVKLKKKKKLIFIDAIVNVLLITYFFFNVLRESFFFLIYLESLPSS